MKLFAEPFDKIKEGTKDIEVRLYDEKRKTIQIGDQITFTKLPENSESLTVTVKGISTFPSFKELFEQFKAERFGHNNLSVEEQITRVRRFYRADEEKRFGVVGIQISASESNLKEA